MPQPLSSKERSLFAQVVKNYEGKQPKKGSGRPLKLSVDADAAIRSQSCRSDPSKGSQSW